MAERLQFREPSEPGALPGTTRLLGLILLLAIGAGAMRFWPTPPPVGVPIEVRGAVPHPGRYLVVAPSLRSAITAAGGTYTGDDRPLSLGDRVQVDPDGVRVLPPSDPVLVGLPIDPNTADATALSAIPGLSRAVADAIVAGRRAEPYRALQDLRRVPGVDGDVIALLAPFVALPVAGPPDLNRASAAELERVDGIGPVLAERIVADRAQRGPFGSPEELGRVAGVGPALVERLRGQVQVQTVVEP